MNGDQWQRLINRSFGVPDVLDETGARELVVEILCRPLPRHDISTASGIAKLLDTIGDLGAAGELNRLFLPSWDDDTDDETKISLEASRLAVTTAGVGEEFVKVARAALVRMVSFVRERPFLDDAGHPFR